jgi:hypothetical protein
MSNTSPFISNTHDEPDHHEDKPAGIAVSVAIGIAIIGAASCALVALAYAIAGILQ